MKKSIFKELYKKLSLAIPVAASIFSLLFILLETESIDVLRFAIGFFGAILGAVLVFSYAQIRSALKKPTVFISYSPRDEQVVNDICKTLEEVNVEVLLDKHELVVGDDIDKKISSMVENSDYIIYVHSDASNHSEWSQKELRKAIIHNKKVLPVVVDQSPVPKSIENLLYANYWYDSKEAMIQLKKAFLNIKHNKAFKSDS
ncbi:toll/interleukin-1 receptor domain-containing protein [Vibrio vulnificus]|nr:toll/interleukin-1 receptor domain-containing protein [Vibrio vulnificus]EJE8540609.1 toll/interleukin-1 receptor domain-containing protein [Vibrio vulnificus]EKA7343463.1 toll/interleukin-1 receptor domain-containing protein [Vibrio vulnificus]EKD9327860.1 toll/interleukin-1 receptor domain-containing protein [Vibrio vulnificus]ELP5932847.1 toll/interleukin-1 receptor domain-containing protein [Vibrio vulnificus]